MNKVPYRWNVVQQLKTSTEKAQYPSHTAGNMTSRCSSEALQGLRATLLPLLKATNQARNCLNNRQLVEQWWIIIEAVRKSTLKSKSYDFLPRSFSCIDMGFIGNNIYQPKVEDLMVFELYDSASIIINFIFSPSPPKKPYIPPRSPLSSTHLICFPVGSVFALYLFLTFYLI